MNRRISGSFGSDAIPMEAKKNIEHPTSNIQCPMISCPASAVSMQSEKRFALTLTLSPRRGNHQWPRWDKSLTGEPSPALEKVLPLPGGEGWGEGERAFQLNSSGLAFDFSSLDVRCWLLDVLLPIPDNVFRGSLPHNRA